MSEGGYKIRDKEGIHFVSFAVVEWIDARLTGRAGIYQKRIQRYFTLKPQALSKRKRTNTL